MQQLCWLVGAGLLAGGGCGSRSSTDAEDFGGFGPGADGGGVAGGPGGGACTAPSCDGCPSCLDACVCVRGDRRTCEQACGQPSGCTAPECSGCDTCMDACFCAARDAERCVSECLGTGGMGGASSTGGGPGVAGSAGVSCGPDVRCTPSSTVGGVRLEPCCRSRFECGLDATPLGASPAEACLPRFADGFFDPSCPSVPGPTGLPLEGCCTPRGICGLDLSILELGCVENGIATPLPPQPCGYGTGGYGTGGYGTGGYGYGGYGATYDGPGGGYGYGGYGPDPIGQCVAQSRTECEVCACSACFTDVTSCFGDPGCPEILQCANATGCNGANCYQPSTCQEVIDRHGGIGSISTQLAVPLFQCLQSAACPCGFAIP